MRHSVWRARWALLVLGVGLALSVVVFAYPPVLRLPLAQGEFLIRWRSVAALRIHPWAIGGLVLLAAASWRLIGRSGADAANPVWRAGFLLRPLAGIPACAAWSLCSPWIGATLAGLALPFGVPLLLAWSLERAVGALQGGASGRPLERRLLALYFLFLLGFGLYFNGRVGEDIGDEAHYLTQLESLVRDGDLDLSNNLSGELPPPGPGRGGRLHYLHCRENMAGRIYSYHAFGLPCLAWPFGWAGFFGRQLVLALIGTGALAGVWACCAAAGAPRRATLVAVASLGLSYPWAVYAIRFLPEILGCGLLAWAFWGWMTQERRPWRSLVVTLLCCGLLPYAHTRFAAPSFVVAFLYGLRGLWIREPLRQKLLRLGLLASIYAVFGVTLLCCQARMFGPAGAYDVGRIFFSYPPAMWGILADRRGLLSVLPVLGWYLASALVAWFSGVGQRRDLFATGLILAAVLASSCSNAAALAGACVPGRYLLTAVPLLLPWTALCLARAGAAARVAFYFLGSLSPFLLLVTSALLKRKGTPFVLPVWRLADVPGFHALWYPLAAFQAVGGRDAVLWTTVFVLAFLYVCALLQTPARRWRLRGVVAAGVVAAGLLGGYRVHAAGQVARLTSRVLLCLPLCESRFQRVPGGAPPRDLFAALDSARFWGHRAPQLLTNRDLGAPAVDSVRSIPRLPANDWKGRPYHWHAVHAPIRSQSDGGVAIRVEGEVFGDAQARFAMRQGAFTLDDGRVAVSRGKFRLDWLVPTRRGRGWVVALARLEGGEGILRINRVLVAPCSPTLLEDARLTLEPSARLLTDADARHEP